MGVPGQPGVLVGEFAVQIPEFLLSCTGSSAAAGGLPWRRALGERAASEWKRANCETV